MKILYLVVGLTIHVARHYSLKTHFFFLKLFIFQAVAAYLSPPIAVVYCLAISWKRMNEKVCLFLIVNSKVYWIQIQNVPSRNDPTQNDPSHKVPSRNDPVTKGPRSRNDPALKVPSQNVPRYERPRSRNYR
jgi:hypothetical protein